MKHFGLCNSPPGTIYETHNGVSKPLKEIYGVAGGVF